MQGKHNSRSREQESSDSKNDERRTPRSALEDATQRRQGAGGHLNVRVADAVAPDYWVEYLGVDEDVPLSLHLSFGSHQGAAVGLTVADARELADALHVVADDVDDARDEEGDA